MTGGASRTDYGPGGDKETHTQEVWKESLMVLDSGSCLMAKYAAHYCVWSGEGVCTVVQVGCPPSDLVGGNR